MHQIASLKNAIPTKSSDKRPQDRLGPRVFAYLRVSTDEQDAASQKVGIVDYTTKKGLSVTQYFEDKTSGFIPAADRLLGKELIPMLCPHDVLIVAEISRLGRSQYDVLTTLKTLSEKKVQVHVVKSGFILDGSLNSKILTTFLTLAAEMERELLSMRVREGQTRARAAGKKIGRPKGSGGYSKLDQHADEIKKHAAKGITKLNLARIFDCDWITMNRWLQRHGVKIKREAV